MLASVFLVGIFHISTTICTAIIRQNISVKDTQGNNALDPLTKKFIYFSRRKLKETVVKLNLKLIKAPCQFELFYEGKKGRNDKVGSEEELIWFKEVKTRKKKAFIQINNAFNRM